MTVVRSLFCTGISCPKKSGDEAMTWHRRLVRATPARRVCSRNSAVTRSRKMIGRSDAKERKYCDHRDERDARNTLARERVDACNQLLCHHSRSTVDRRTYQQPRLLTHCECCAPPRQACSTPAPQAAASLNRARATTHPRPRSRARTGSTRGETAATCAAPSRDAPRSGSRANRSRNRSRRPIRRTRAPASRA